MTIRRAPTHCRTCMDCGRFVQPCVCEQTTHHPADWRCDACERADALGFVAFCAGRTPTGWVPRPTLKAEWDEMDQRDRSGSRRVALAVIAAAKEMEERHDG